MPVTRCNSSAGAYTGIAADVDFLFLKISRLDMNGLPCDKFSPIRKLHRCLN